MGIPFYVIESTFPGKGQKQAYEIERKLCFCIYRRSGKKALRGFRLAKSEFSAYLKKNDECYYTLVVLKGQSRIFENPAFSPGEVPVLTGATSFPAYFFKVKEMNITMTPANIGEDCH